MTDERTYHDSGDVPNPYADSGDYTWDDDDTQCLESRLYDALSELAALREERDTVAAMTVAVYCLFAAGSFAAGWLLRSAWFW